MHTKRFSKLSQYTICVTLVWSTVNLVACDSEEPEAELQLAEGIYGLQGEIRPNATPDQQEIFISGREVATRRFTLKDGLGPYFNVTFCGGCHEKPDFGGSAGHYRDFYIYGEQLAGGVFSPSGPRSGVLTTFTDPASIHDESSQVNQEEQGQNPLSKLDPDGTANLFTLRNPIPFFGIGLLAEIPEEELLANADPDDLDGDGISGRPNFDQGYVGRFGLKSQTVSIENFIRGPLFNHLGITTNPLSPELQAALPIPSVSMDRFASEEDALVTQSFHLNQSDEDPTLPRLEVQQFHQAAAPSEPLTDTDGIADPELSEDDLFALVSWAMLLAAPIPDPLDMISERGEGIFHAVQCASCHIPTLAGPRGLIPAYTDLLLHDMGPELADGVVMALASGSEFRTQPLWGVSSTGPYLYDGRAHSLDEAITFHGGEAEQSRDAYLALTSADREALIAFLESLGGRLQRSSGLLPPNSPTQLGEGLSEPVSPFTDAEEVRYKRGRELFDRDIGISEGLGPVINGDSCRGCHFEPAIGGSGPTGVSAVRQLLPRMDPIEDDSSELSRDGHLVRRFHVHGGHPPSPISDTESSDQAVIDYEVRQALPSFGLGILDAIPEASILRHADPDDLDEDGVRGRARVLPNGRIGRFGWRAQLPELRDFIADALAAELGLTIPAELELSPSITSDDDSIPDPEFSAEQFEDLYFFLQHLAPPTIPVDLDEQVEIDAGEELFNTIGCETCHVAKLHDNQERAAYTNLLLHAVQGESQSDRLFRTPPLWGVGLTGTYWHDGRASTLWEAIELHQGEALSSRQRALELNTNQRTQLITFVRTR